MVLLIVLLLLLLLLLLVLLLLLILITMITILLLLLLIIMITTTIISRTRGIASRSTCTLRPRRRRYAMLWYGMKWNCVTWHGLLFVSPLSLLVVTSFLFNWHGHASTCYGAIRYDTMCALSEGGMTWLETLIELKFLNSCFSSSIFSQFELFELVLFIETRQAVPRRAIRGKSSDSRQQYLSQQYPPPLFRLYRCLWTDNPFMAGCALHSRSKKCSPAPDLVFPELIFPRVCFSGGVFFLQTPVSHACMTVMAHCTMSRHVIWHVLEAFRWRHSTGELTFWLGSSTIPVQIRPLQLRFFNYWSHNISPRFTLLRSTHTHTPNFRGFESSVF